MDKHRKYLNLKCSKCGKKYFQQKRVFNICKWKNRCPQCRKKFYYCQDCGKEVYRNSKKCKSCAQKIIRKQCLICKKEISLKAKKFCLSCHNKNQDKGLSKERTKFQNSKEWKRLRINCFKRDKFKCQSCNKKFNYKKLNAHHILGWKERRGLRLCLKNLITLCRKCHEFLHWGCL
jgi:hypothetical protein